MNQKYFTFLLSFLFYLSPYFIALGREKRRKEQKLYRTEVDTFCDVFLSEVKV